MGLPHRYRRLQSGTRELATLYAVLRRPPSLTDVQRRLRESGLCRDAGSPARDRERPDARWEVAAALVAPETDVRVFLQSMPGTDHVQWRGEALGREVRDAFALGVSMQLAGPPTTAVEPHRKLLLALAPEAVAVLDDDAQWGLRPDDLLGLAPWRLCRVPLEDGREWVHTHGLLRFGAPEVEWVGPPGSAERVDEVAARLVEGAEVPPWVPWEDAPWSADFLRDRRHRAPAAAILTAPLRWPR